MASPKLASGSILTLEDQVKLYAEIVGQEAAERQVKLARLAAKKCVCEPRKLKRHWNGVGSPMTVKSVHDMECPKHKPWMIAHDEEQV